MIKNRKWPIIILTMIIIVFILELLPYGAVLNFANLDGEPLRKTYSYFNPTPYGYANFGPFITAILTCVLLIVSTINLFADNGRIKLTIRIVSFITFIISLTPLPIHCYSVLGGMISILLLAVFILSLKKRD